MSPCGEIKAGQQENRMNINVRRDLGCKAARLADLIVQAKHAQIWFRSETQFLEIVGWPPGLQHALKQDVVQPARLGRSVRLPGARIRSKAKAARWPA